MKKSNLEKDLIRIQHMLNAIEEISSFMKGRSQKYFEQDRMLILAVIKEIEIIGEAASKLSKEFKENYSHIPWDIIIATRHRLIHGYFDIDVKVIWNTVTRDLSAIKEEFEKILSTK